MTKREAKRVAYGFIVEAIEAKLDDGLEWNFDEISENDAVKIEECMSEIAADFSARRQGDAR